MFAPSLLIRLQQADGAQLIGEHGRRRGGVVDGGVAFMRREWSPYWPFDPPHGPFRLLRRSQLAGLPNQRERWSSRSC